MIRLAWDNAKVKDGAKPEWRSVPPGEYTLIGYRIRRQDDAGTEWFVSANSPKGIRPFTVERGRPTRLEISPAIHIGARGHKGKDGKFAVWLSVKGEHDSGLSIYRDGDLIPVRYTIRNKAGKQLVSGTIDYG